MVNYAHENQNLLKSFIFHEVGKAAVWRQNPKKVHHLKERKTMVETFNEMCEVYGNEAMEYPEFEYWYIKFYSGDFDMEHNWRPSEDCPPSALHRFIFSDVMMDVPIWESYKKYCKIEGNEMTDYPEFEFWYMRFARGEFDVDYDRSADPTPRSFTDLPVHIFEIIFEDFNLFEKMIIRKVSKPLQSLIDSWKPDVRRIRISIDSTETVLDFDNNRIIYSDPSYYNDPSKHGQCAISIGNLQFLIRNEQHWRLGFQDLIAILGHPELQLYSLEIARFERQHTENFQKMLSSLNGAQIHVENLRIWNNSVHPDVLPFIQHLKPGVLREVDLDTCYDEETMNRIAGFEQFKKLQMLKFGDRVKLSDISFHCFLGFRRVTIGVSGIGAGKYTASAIKTLVKSTVLEIFIINNRRHFRVEATMKLLGNRGFPRVGNRPNICRHRVPKSIRSYEIEVTNNMVRIERK